MRFFILTIASVFLSSAAFAEVAPINLQPAIGQKTVSVSETKNYTGSCGRAVVDVVGVSEPSAMSGNYFVVNNYSGHVIVHESLDNLMKMKNPRPLKELVLRDQLPGYNNVTCVATKFGHRLVVFGFHGGNCAIDCDQSGFYIIDPERFVFLSPKDGKCDKKCAVRLLGKAFPEEIESFFLF